MSTFITLCTLQSVLLSRLEGAEHHGVEVGCPGRLPSAGAGPARLALLTPCRPSPSPGTRAATPYPHRPARRPGCIAAAPTRWQRSRRVARAACSRPPPCRHPAAGPSWAHGRRPTQCRASRRASCRGRCTACRRPCTRLVGAAAAVGACLRGCTPTAPSLAAALDQRAPGAHASPARGACLPLASPCLHPLPRAALPLQAVAHRAAQAHQPAASLRHARPSQLPLSQPQGMPWSQVGVWSKVGQHSPRRGGRAGGAPACSSPLPLARPTRTSTSHPASTHPTPAHAALPAGQRAGGHPAAA